MRGIKINFGTTGPVFDFDDAVKDFRATVQNALVNAGTMVGSDPIFVSRGTNLMKDGTSGRMINLVWANHSANFAALNTLAFIQQTEIQSNPSKMQDFKLQSTQLIGQRIELAVQATSVDGEVIGTLTTL